MDRREFLAALTEQIRTKRARQTIVKEMEAHIEDQKMGFMAEGMTAAEAEEAAVREMGDPVEAGVALDRIYRPRMKWSVLAGVILISILGLVLQIIVVMNAHPSGGSESLLLTGEGVGKHLAVMAAGIVLMTGICWMDYTLLDKYAVAFWIAVNGLLLLCAAESPIVNGRPFYLTHASWLIIPFYCGILYHFRGQGAKGMGKSFLCLCVPMLILFFYLMISCIFITGTAGMILLHAAVYQKWFGEKRGKLYLKLWGIIAIMALALLGAMALYRGGVVLAGYQMERIAAWISPGKYGESIYLQSVAQAAEDMRNGEVYLTVNMMEEIRNSFLWLYLFRYLGTAKGLLLTILVVGFWSFLFLTVRRQKNQFGRMVGLGCVVFLAIETLMYMGMNFGIVPLGTAFLPFLSNGGAFLLITYFYMGILLSVESVQLGTG